MSKDDGGNAFPVADYDHMAMQPATVDEHKRQLMGMSLRDYFAARALAPAFPGMSTRDVQYAAEAAYELADAMLAARNA
ncbi:hypothetical protein GIV96_11020 [Pseudomonas syringae]|uniref:hypothetical protein n=1 Tax=Pseudomonas syringae TaxID=317 RepID=UPI000C129EA5|nr:hypothetical protein [Pseudomonas syringae]MCF5179604.1 hypothetical protein [Pseudomonas syringae]MCF5312512.1 hypothetical protein [Pseudomonas syringae]MCF5361125.1 hypothetical protein [Pseudomonas syringae]MCF5392430.1 hypothetical protein [Pseudomonas syringae]MCF5397108.1 hypothetical protein [Pseudomonas syringae]